MPYWKNRQALLYFLLGLIPAGILIAITYRRDPVSRWAGLISAFIGAAAILLLPVLRPISGQLARKASLTTALIAATAGIVMIRYSREVQAAAGLVTGSLVLLIVYVLTNPQFQSTAMQIKLGAAGQARLAVRILSFFGAVLGANLVAIWLLLAGTIKVVTATPQISAAPINYDQPLSTITRSEIKRRLDSLPLLQQDDAAKIYVGYRVEWPCTLNGAQAFQPGSLFLFLDCRDSARDAAAWVSAVVKMDPASKQLKKGDRLRVTGTITSGQNAAIIVLNHVDYRVSVGATDGNAPSQ